LPFLIAIIISYSLNPLVKKFERKGISKSTAIIILYLFFILLIINLIIFVVPELINNTKELSETLPNIIGNYRDKFDGALSIIKSSKWPSEIKNSINAEIEKGIVLIQEYIMGILRKSLSMLINTLNILLNLFLSLIIAYYLMKDSDYFREWVLSLVPGKWRSGLSATGREINSVLANFIQGQLLTALIVGFLETIGLFIVKIKYPLILGLFGGLANIIPYFGPIIGAIPATAIALLQSPMKAVWTILVFVIVQQIDNNFISPKIIEGKLGLHPVATILAVLVGSEFFGIAGMLFAVPIAAIIRIIVIRSINAIVS